MTHQTDEPSSDARNTRPRRKWYQFSIWSMLVLLTLVCVAAAYWRRMVTAYEGQATAAEEITKLSGWITSEPAVPDWLRWLPLADRCNKVVAVNLQERDFPEGSLQSLAQLPDVERLYLARSSVSDNDLEYVGKLTNLRRLSLWRTDITSEGLKQLEGLSDLRLLDIHGNRFLDETSLECLCHWPRLRLLIHDLTVTDRGLGLLAEHPNVPVTELRASQVSDRGLDDLVKLQRLDRLTVDLECGREQMMRLAQLQQLKRLTVFGRLDLPMERLQAAMPRLKVVEPRRLSEVSLGELAGRWGNRAQDLEIRGTNPWTHESFERYPVHFTITQREPSVRIDAELKHVTWEDIRRFRKLESVTIDGRGFDGSQLAHLRDLPRLTELHLRVHLDAETMRMIGQLDGLQRLDLSGYKVALSPLEPDACDPLGSLDELQTFTAAVTRMQDQHLHFLRDCPKLRRVYLWDLGITGETLSRLSEAPRLEELLVFNCHQLRNEDLEHLKTFKNLRTCWIDGGLIYRSAMDSILQHLPSLDMDPQERKLYRSGETGLSHRALLKLPDL